MNKYTYLLLGLLLIILDQLTKILTFKKSFFIINYTTNTGAAFGIFQGFNTILIFISFLVILFIILYLKRAKQHLPLILILSGIIGNLIDRILLGFVRDFIDIRIWPVFNLADFYITIGALILILHAYKETKFRHR